MKACTKCGVTKPHTEYYKYKTSPDGLMSTCKDCKKTYQKTQQNLAHNIAYRELYAKGKGLAASNKAKVKYKQSNPTKTKAHSVVSNAIRDGKLHKQKCEVCGNKVVHAHHDDYSKPLTVRWLCDKHHNAWHSLYGEALNG